MPQEIQHSTGSQQSKNYAAPYSHNARDTSRPVTRHPETQAKAGYQPEKTFRPINKPNPEHTLPLQDKTFQPISVLEKQNHPSYDSGPSSQQQDREFGSRYLPESNGHIGSRGHNNAHSYNKPRNPSQDSNPYDSAMTRRPEEHNYTSRQPTKPSRTHRSDKPQQYLNFQPPPQQDNGHKPRSLSNHRSTADDDDNDDDGGFKSRGRIPSSSTVV